MSKAVYVKQNRTGKGRWYKGYVVGTRTFNRTSMEFMGQPAKEYNEDKLLVKMSVGGKVEVWESATYEAVK